MHRGIALIKLKELTFCATVEVCPHRNMTMPGLGVHFDITSDDWFRQHVTNDGMPVIVAAKNLKYAHVNKKRNGKICTCVSW